MLEDIFTDHRTDRNREFTISSIFRYRKLPINTQKGTWFALIYIFNKYDLFCLIFQVIR